MSLPDIDLRFMRRALQLARLGADYASPNPMVGAVIAGPTGLILGEGWHRCVGQGHAEVNAVAAAEAAGASLAQSTMYVTLEPCSHQGRTPPCARLIIERGIPRVVVAVADPYERVSGRGIAMLRDAGVDVTLLPDAHPLAVASRDLNLRFITAHTLRRPFVTLKWAQSADGLMDRRRRSPLDGDPRGAARLSGPLGTLEVHRLRALHDAVVTGSGTVIMDNPRLDNRLWPSGRTPRKVVLDRRGRVSPDAAIHTSGGDVTIVGDYGSLEGLLRELYAQGVTSVLVEAGPQLLQSFIDAGLWDRARIETSPVLLHDGPAAPLLPGRELQAYTLGGNTVRWFAPAPGA